MENGVKWNESSNKSHTFLSEIFYRLEIRKDYEFMPRI